MTVLHVWNVGRQLLCKRGVTKKQQNDNGKTSGIHGVDSVAHCSILPSGLGVFWQEPILQPRAHIRLDAFQLPACVVAGAEALTSREGAKFS